MADYEQTAPEKKVLYRHIFNELLRKIETGQLKAGDKIPSERELCLHFNVSRITVRQAIYEAISRGMLYRVQGKGTFVSNQLTVADSEKIVQKLSKIVPFSDTVQQIGLKGKTTVLAGEMVPGSLEINSILGLEREEHLLYLMLLGYANGYRLVAYHSYFSYTVGMKMLEIARSKEKSGEAFSSYELYALLPELKPSHVDQTFEAAPADTDIASLLDIDKGSPVLLITSLVYDAENRPLEFKKAFYRGDRYKFNMTRLVPVICTGEPGSS